MVTRVIHFLHDFFNLRDLKSFWDEVIVPCAFWAALLAVPVGGLWLFSKIPNGEKINYNPPNIHGIRRIADEDDLWEGGVLSETHKRSLLRILRGR
jgi:hypothetical protein